MILAQISFGNIVVLCATTAFFALSIAVLWAINRSIGRIEARMDHLIMLVEDKGGEP